MAYIPNYTHDIFVSYRHSNNEPMEGVKEGWVTTLVKNVQTLIIQRLKGNQTDFNLWMDFKLRYNEHWTPQIMTALEESAVILIIMSAAYLESDWCLREKDSFLSFIKNRKSPNTRIFMVWYDEVDYNDFPDELKELSPYKFWIKDKLNEEIKILGFPKPNPDQEEYYDKVLKLSNDIAREMNNLKNISGKALPPPKSIVFLAEVTDDLEDKRDEVKNYLDQLGIKSMPDTFYPREPMAFKKNMENDLKKCEVYIQLLSELPGKHISPVQTYPMFQYEIALANHKTILQWRSRDLDLSQVRDEEYRKILNSISVMASDIEEFKREIKNKLETKPDSDKPSRAFVFVKMESEDKFLAEKVSKFLSEKGMLVIRSKASGKSEDIRRELVENLMDCDALIIIYGNTTVEWVQGQIRQQYKIIAQRETPLKALAVIVGPPEPKDPLDIELKNLNIISCINGLDIIELEHFIENI